MNTTGQQGMGSVGGSQKGVVRLIFALLRRRRLDHDELEAQATPSTSDEAIPRAA